MILGFVVASLFLYSRERGEEQGEEYGDSDTEEERPRIEERGSVGRVLRRAVKTLLACARVCVVVYCFCLDTSAAPTVVLDNTTARGREAGGVAYWETEEEEEEEEWTPAVGKET